MVNKMSNEKRVLQRAFEIGWGITKSDDKSDEKIMPVLARGAMAAAKNPAVQEGAKKVVGNVVGGVVADKVGGMIGKAGDFNPDDDTCEACGGQKTPEHPYYGPDGPENGNCAKELPGCR